MNLIFLLLEVHANVGGIQRFNSNVLYVLDKFSRSKIQRNSAYSLKDSHNKFHFNNLKFEFENNNRILYLLKAIIHIIKSDLIIFGHINLIFPLGILLILFPYKKSILFTHGIEVWNKLPWYKRILLRRINTIVAVSKFTANKLFDYQGIDKDNIVILPNTISNEFVVLSNLSQIRLKYNIDMGDFILLTICRMDSSEKYKGYDTIIKLIPKIIVKYPNIKYVLCGKSDDNERARLEILVKDSGCQSNIIILGYVPEQELSSIYQMSNLFLMPSKGEGFGIVFLEALAHGKPVIGGNKDGTVDALINGELGILVDPDNPDEILEAIVSVLERTVDGHFLDEDYLKQKVFTNFGIDKFSERLKNIIFPN